MQRTHGLLAASSVLGRGGALTGRVARGIGHPCHGSGLPYRQGVRTSAPAVFGGAADDSRARTALPLSMGQRIQNRGVTDGPVGNWADVPRSLGREFLDRDMGEG
jgi:hypothetical protein